MSTGTTPPSLDSQLQHAFVESPTALQYTMKNSKGEESKLFVLKASEYYNLQAYVTLGMGLPSSDARFESEFPKTELKALIDLDAKIYDQLKNTLGDIYKHCYNFDSKTVGKLVTLSGKISTFCDDSATYIGDEGTLKDQVAILIDKNVSTKSQKFIDASKTAQAILKSLSGFATQLEGQCQDVVNDLTLFKGQTVVDKDNADSLYTKFIKPGPSKGVKPYSEQLQAELAALRVTATELNEDYQKKKEEYKHDVIVASTAVTYIWNFPFGTIAGATTMGIYTDKAIKAKEAYEKDEADLLKNHKDQETLTRCIRDVTHICVELTDIKNTVEAAITALGKLQQMFGRLASDFDAIHNKTDAIIGKIRSDDPYFKALAQIDLNATVKKWQDIKFLITDYQTNAPIKWKGKGKQ